MSAIRYVHWQEDRVWLGYFEQFPDYLTQARRWRNSRRTCGICTATSQVVKSPESAGSPN